MNYQLKLMELDELRKLLNQVEKVGGGQSSDAALKSFLKSHYQLSSEEMSQVVSFLAGKEKQNDIKSELLDLFKQIHAYLEVLQIRPRKYDAENPDIAKLKTLVANRKSMLKRKAREEDIEI